MRWGLIALLFVVIAIALILLNHVRNDWNLAHDSKGWPTVPGVVVSTSIIDHSHRTFSFDPHVTYSYTVDGRSYIGDILRAGGYDYDSRAGVNTKLAEYPVGSTVDVLYDPENPSRSVLETGSGGRWWSVVGLGIGLAFGGLLVLTRYFSDYWKARR